MSFHVPEMNRYQLSGLPMTSFLSGNNGFFIIPDMAKPGHELRCQASDGSGWEHVSISVGFENQPPYRTPTWEEMCRVKAIFWDEDDCVLQYHTPKKDYVNCHPFVLHLWRNTQVSIPVPDPILVGPPKR